MHKPCSTHFFSLKKCFDRCFITWKESCRLMFDSVVSKMAYYTLRKLSWETFSVSLICRLQPCRKLPQHNYVSRYYLHVNRPFFWRKSYTKWPFPPIFNVKFKNFASCARVWKFYQFSAKNGKLSVKFDPVDTKW